MGKIVEQSIVELFSDEFAQKDCGNDNRRSCDDIIFTARTARTS